MGVPNEIWIACDSDGSACLFAEKPDMRRSGIYAISGNAKDARCEHLRAFPYAVPPGECRKFRLVTASEPESTAAVAPSKPPRGVSDPRWFELFKAATSCKYISVETAANVADEAMKLMYAREDAEKGRTPESDWAEIGKFLLGRLVSCSRQPDELFDYIPNPEWPKLRGTCAKDAVLRAIADAEKGGAK